MSKPFHDLFFSLLVVVFLGGGGMLINETDLTAQKAIGSLCWMVGSLLVGYIVSRKGKV